MHAPTRRAQALEGVRVLVLVEEFLAPAQVGQQAPRRFLFKSFEVRMWFVSVSFCEQGVSLVFRTESTKFMRHMIIGCTGMLGLVTVLCLFNSFVFCGHVHIIA